MKKLTVMDSYPIEFRELIIAESRLTKLDREIAVLRYLDEQTHEQLAERMEVDVHTISNRLFAMQTVFADTIQKLNI